MFESPPARDWSSAGAYWWMIFLASFMPGRLACVVALDRYVVERTPSGFAPLEVAIRMKTGFDETLLLNVNGCQFGIFPSVASAAIAALGVAKMTNTSAPLLAMWTTWEPTTAPESVTL